MPRGTNRASSRTCGSRTRPPRTASTGIREFEVPYGTVFAGSIAAIAPIVVLVPVFRCSVVSGLTPGAVKG